MDAREIGMIAIDADGHVHEPEEMFSDYLAPNSGRVRRVSS